MLAARRVRPGCQAQACEDGVAAQAPREEEEEVTRNFFDRDHSDVREAARQAATPLARRSDYTQAKGHGRATLSASHNAESGSATAPQLGGPADQGRAVKPHRSGGGALPGLPSREGPHASLVQTRHTCGSCGQHTLLFAPPVPPEVMSFAIFTCPHCGHTGGAMSAPLFETR